MCWYVDILMQYNILFDGDNNAFVQPPKWYNWNSQENIPAADNVPALYDGEPAPGWYNWNPQDSIPAADNVPALYDGEPTPNKRILDSPPLKERKRQRTGNPIAYSYGDSLGNNTNTDDDDSHAWAWESLFVEYWNRFNDTNISNQFNETQ